MRYLIRGIISILFLLSLAMPTVAAPVGGPELSIPEESLYLKQEAVKKELDRYEYNMNIKTGLDVDIVTSRDLESAPADTPNAELEGTSVMFKVGNNFYNIVEPYIKIGTSSYEIKWNQHSEDVKVESNTGFTWGMGVKAKLLESDNYGVNLSLDLQYRNMNLDVDNVKVGGTTLSSRVNETFEIKEWQISLLTSKKLIVPIGINDYYIVPYGGVTYTAAEVDVSFTRSTNGILYSTFNADDEKPVGFVIGCDIMPSLLSYYLLNFELRLINETAFTLGGTLKF